MDKTVFDGAAFVSIDLNTGRIASPGRDRLALISKDILALIAPGDALNRAAITWGKSHGETIVGKNDGDDVGVDALATHLSGTLAALGLGKVRMEVRGDALLFRVKGGFEAETATVNAVIIGGFIAGYLGAVSNYGFVTLDLGDVGDDRLFWVGNPEAVDSVRQSVENGAAPFEAIDALMIGEA